ncbi:MAG: hypothetical protein HY763_15975 [Planctomycetes bacterium]|nr:hypothetical protein [Planctomycetota bacterium]
MVRALAAAAVASLVLAATASAAELNVSVTDAAGNSVTQVQPGATVNYKVTGQLSDTSNEGLALFGFDLELTGPGGTVALPKAGIPTTVPMNNFVIPLGISNPGTVTQDDGYGGTIIAGKLVQCGGGQNTIKNTIANADFPIGTPILGVAKGSAQVLLTGSFTAPAVEAQYTLTLSALFGNVIRAGEVITNPFLATDALGNSPTIGNLTINVVSCVPDIAGTSVPAQNTLDARYPHDINNAALKFGYDTFDVDVPGSALACSLAPASFSVAEVGGDGTAPGIASVVQVDADTVRITLDAKIEPQAWTVISPVGANSAKKLCYGFLPGDVNGSRASNAQDITAIVNALNNAVPRPISSTDINRSGAANAQDITALVNLLNGAAAFDPWLNRTIAASPCP